MSRFLDKKLVFLKPYIPGEQPKGIKKLIKLNTNESPFPPCPGVKKAAGRASKMLNLYSDPACTNAVNAIADFYGLNSKNVFLSNGSDETLAFIFHGFCPKGAAFADITYGFYKVFADMFGIKTRIVPLDNDFNIKVEDYKNLDQTIFIANPNAPTGILLPVCMIEELLLQSPDRLVVVDEAYIDFGGESAVRLIEKYDNIIVVQTFSKSRSLAVARLGFAIANDDLISD
ncbi:MAG: histidinol-phosphate transaminase, partial [Eubacteriales bacterium]|nr:histidinol-phosphate transaminase [Eubacteriales bacterium]